MANEAYHSSEYFKQNRRMLLDGDPRALICFCIDVSESMENWWIEEGGLRQYTGKGYSDGQNVNYFNLKDIRPGYAHYKRIDKLNEVLTSFLKELKRDRNISSKVAVSVVAYSRFGKVIYDFVDCEALDIDACICKSESPETAMGDGLRTALFQIDDMESEMRQKGKDSYTPLLVFMTDGTPTDDPRAEFAEIRQRVEKGDLHVFPLGIGSGADMVRLRDMFPVGGAPERFCERYIMEKPADYEKIFEEIKSNVRKREKVIVSEGNSNQSEPALERDGVINNQMGETFDYDDVTNWVV